MKLRHQLVTLSLGLSLLLIVILGSLLALFIRHLLESNLEEKGGDLARVLAGDSRVVQALQWGSDPGLRDYVQGICSRTDAAYMVVTDEHARRLSHPSPELVGGLFRGEDIWPSLNERSSYCSKDVGTLGPAIRCFAPVIGPDGRAIGAVVVGYLMQTVESIYLDRIALLISAIGAVLGCGLLLALWVQHRLRRTLLDLEPETIVNRFVLQELVLEHISEGVIALDSRGHIRMLNSAAFYQLRLPGTGRHSLLGQPLSELSPPLAPALTQVETELGFTVHGESFVGRWQAVEGKIPGRLLIFSRPEVTGSLGMQVTHLRQYAEMLRMQTHEFANKLSSLSGLLQLGHVDQAVELIQQESEACQTMLHDLLRAIEDKPVAGLILGKFSRARELGVELVLDPDSALGEYPAAVSADLITLIGNLLDNGIRAAWARRKQCPPRVLISLNDFGRRLVIEVEDSGEGVDEALADHLFDYGISRQTGDHGVGLFLVKETVARRGGVIEWRRTAEQTTLFGIYLNKNQLV
ncbi:sensor histidine kinase [Aeromonas dhakensis]|uniref:ATP-binding protein n=1 Tax=Aeromonas dhakensis TaxID=196024 RepID=UPI00029B0594|nr:sensor histidine kinase [Aeromonas dhakensis]AHV36076.1 histidine kinase [Aeromonas hydrophila YL17]BEJ50403.1 sensor histidine kinase [Aeromonas dhakensis]HDZ8909902.1 sensor histidine kinase [Aeromonas dhakensis]